MRSSTSIQAVPTRPDLRTHSSTQIEKCLEHRFLGAVTAGLLMRGIPYEVMRGEVDCHGHDIVIAANGIIRHIQLKARVAGGKTRRVAVATRLAHYPSACVVWLTYDPATYDIVEWRWFGSQTGQIPSLGDRVAKHSKGTGDGTKLERPGHRTVNQGSFERGANAGALIEWLFDLSPASMSRQLLLGQFGQSQPNGAGPDWLQAVRHGNVAAIPEGLGWEGSVELAHLVDGYSIAEARGQGDGFRFADQQLERATADGVWPGDAVDLFASLFLEHRRWRQSSPFDPDGAQRRLLDQLVFQLRTALAELFHD